VATGSLLVAGAGLLASTELHGIPAMPARAVGAPATARASEIRLADDDAAAALAGAPFSAARGAAGNVATGAPPAPALTSGSALGGAPRGSPESRLIGVYRAYAEGRTQAAIDGASALTHDVPGFRLAQLVYADLLSARSGDPERLDAFTKRADAATHGELSQLREEATLRLRALQERPPVDQVPAEFIMLPKTVHHAVAVDTSRARLYLFQNTPQGLRLVSDHYISVGKQGVDKTAEGDQRTPLGVYFVSDRIGGEALEKRFGAGALQLNYPNAFDRLRGRTGGGIYVHGVPENTYSRPPKDSDGCVVMANDELVAMMNTIPLHDTPVIITRHLHWVPDNAQQVQRAEILDAVSHWQSVRAAGETNTLDAFYQTGARPAAPVPPVAALDPRRGPGNAVRKPAAGADKVQFSELSVLTWQDERETMVVTFHERSPRTSRETVLRQYWERQRDKRWTIVAEGTVR
jgi:lipoprotein-anchoring transpeptidase ErfK/SrfK